MPGAGWAVSLGPWYCRLRDARIQGNVFVRILALALPEKASRVLLGVAATSSAAALGSPYDSDIFPKTYYGWGLATLHSSGNVEKSESSLHVLDERERDTVD